jgi:outer membrane protein assembly factor BamB
MSYREGEAPLEVDRSVLVVGIGGHVVGVSRSNGEILWKHSLPEGGHGEVFIAFRFGLLVVSADGARAFRLDYRTGETVWAAATRASGRATILIEPDLVVVAKGGYADAFDHDGKPLWTQGLEGYGHGRLALAFPGNVAQADDYGTR